MYLPTMVQIALLRLNDVPLPGKWEVDLWHDPIAIDVWKDAKESMAMVLESMVRSGGSIVRCQDNCYKIKFEIPEDLW